MGVLKNVLIMVQNFIISMHLALNMEEDVNISITFGKSFLVITSTIIDMKHAKFKFQIGGEEVEFNLSDMEIYHSVTDHVNAICVIE